MSDSAAWRQNARSGGAENPFDATATWGLFSNVCFRERAKSPSMTDGEEEHHAASPSASADGSKPKKSGSKSAGKKDAAKTPKARTKAARGKTAGDADSSSAQVRAGSKQAKIIELMKRAKGATLDDMIEATDWLPHTTRAALTGLRKRGFTLERIKDEAKGSVYRIKSDRAPVAA
jgi:hypothetical protein